MRRTDVQFKRFPIPVATEGAAMLRDLEIPPLSEFDQHVYQLIVPEDHYLRQALAVIPWDDFHDQLACYYSPDMGRPAKTPVLMLKLEFLRYYHNLSDRGVMDRAVTDMAFRHFLQIPVSWSLPHPSLLCEFRGRIGHDGFARIFESIVAVAREHGIVKDRLRIKDATHVIGNMAVPSALALVAQTRDKLLAATEPFAPPLVEGERINLEMLRETTQNLKPAERLVSRVAQLREMLFWVDELSPPEKSDANRAWQKFLVQRDLAHKILEDQDNPNAGDRTLSTTDPDARRGKHGEWFDGYLVDILIDADSEIITAINVLPAGADEAADAIELIRQEEAAHGNDVQALSIDGVGFNGPVLRELEDPDGLNVDTYVPTPKESETGLFTPQDFQQDSEGKVVTCPAGKTSKYVFYDAQKKTTKYRFEIDVCQACPCCEQCMKKRPRKHGRTVCKTDYQAEHDQARQKTTTTQYAAVRREHPKVERKLGELMNRHGGRRARYNGTPKVFIQQSMASIAANVKRMVRLGCAPTEQFSPGL